MDMHISIRRAIINYRLGCKDLKCPIIPEIPKHGRGHGRPWTVRAGPLTLDLCKS